MNNPEITVYFDGSCEPINPNGHAHAGALVILPNGKKIKLSKCVGTGEGMSNNVAEYSGLKLALDYLIKKSLNHQKIIVYGDSVMVINQMRGIWKINIQKPSRYTKYALDCKKLLDKFSKIIFSWTPREENTQADILTKCKKTKDMIFPSRKKDLTNG